MKVDKSKYCLLFKVPQSFRPATWEEALYVVATKMHEVSADEKAAVVGGLNDVGQFYMIS